MYVPGRPWSWLLLFVYSLNAAASDMSHMGHVTRIVDGAAICGAEPLPSGVSAAETRAALRVLNPHANAGLTILLRGTSQLDAFPGAKAGFQSAAAEWERYIVTPITVVINVDFGPTRFGTPYPDGVLGSASGDRRVYSYSVVRSALLATDLDYKQLYSRLPTGTLQTDVGPVSTVVATSANLRAIRILGPAPLEGETVPSIGFNSKESFDFDRSDGIGAGTYDFHALAVHEIGHILGFTSLAGNREMDSTLPPAASPLDFLRLRPGLGDGAYASTNRILSSGGQQITHFGSNFEVPLSTGRPDGTGGDSRQASHWKDDELWDWYSGIMDPTLTPRRESHITLEDLVAFDMIGYQLRYPAKPAAPTNLRATSVSGTQVMLAWNDNSTDESEFRLWMKRSGGDWRELGGVRANRTSASVSGLTAGTSYLFSIQASNAGGYSDYSNDLSLTTETVAQGCSPSVTAACVLGGRFRVSVRYRAGFDNNPADSDAQHKTVSGFSTPAAETVFFYFGNDTNIEMMVKMLDQGNTNSQGQQTIAVLFGTATPLRIELSITDTRTGLTKRYQSEFGQMRGTTDFTAFVK